MTDVAVAAVGRQVNAGERITLERPDHIWRRLMQNGRFVVGGAMLLIILGTCIVTLYWTGRESLGVDADGYPIDNPYYFDAQDSSRAEQAPSREHITKWFGTDKL